MKQRRQTSATYGTRQSGVGLIEVLIAVLVFAVGVLGMITMQVEAKRSSYEATQRSIATSLARDILERMRSNPDGLDSYVIGELGSTAVAAGTDCNATSCSTTQLAGRDLYEWNELLQGATEITLGAAKSGGLIDSRACITNTTGFVTVAIAWKGVNDMTNPTDSTCGEGSGLYGTANVKRRLLYMTTFVRT